ncbi:MAG: YHS domain-containing (seleno)protein [Sneathiella sp.]
MIKFLRTALIGLALSTALFTSAFAAGNDVNATTTGLAMRGFDPVSYFQDSGPVAGGLKYTTEYNGATYRFASKDNKEEFEADPVAFTPAYGGYCAFGTAMGFKFDGDPSVWKIVDKKLYLNLSPAVQKRWVSEEADFIVQANTNWVGIKDTAPEALQK